MICSKCGFENADNMKFCTNCGTELVKETPVEAVAEVVEEKTEAVAEEVKETVAEVKETVAEEVVEVKEEVKEVVADAAPVVAKEKKAKEPKEKKAAGNGIDFKKYLVPAVAGVAALVVLIILIAAIASGTKNGGYTQISEDAVLQITTRDGDLYAIFLNGDELKLDDEKAYNETYSMDGSVVCYENEEDELVIIREGEVIRTGIDEAQGVWISNGGDTMLFYTDCEYVDYYDALYEYEDSIKVGTLNLYDIKKKDSVEVEEAVVVDSAVLSPDGKTVAYVAEYEATDDFKSFISVNGKEPEEFGKEKHIFAISDKATYVYYTDEDRVYVQKKDQEEKLASGLQYVEVMFNEDNTEMMFYNEGKTYITVKGGEKKKVCNERLTEVVLEDDAAIGGQDIDTERGDIEVTYAGVDTFEEKLFYSYYTDEIYYMLKKFDTEKLASSTYEYVLSDDGKSLLYNNYSDIVKVTKFAKGGEKETLARNANAQDMYADGDLKHIYILNDDKELYYVKKGKGKKIADDVTAACVSSDGQYCYYIVDDEDLCYSKKGGKEKELLSVEDGSMFTMKEAGIVFIGTKEDGTSTLYKLDGKKMKVVFVEEDRDYDDVLDDAINDAINDALDYLD